jgi:hypothetical protein
MERSNNLPEKHTLQSGTVIDILVRLKLKIYGVETVVENPRSRIRGKQNKNERRKKH